MGSTPSLTSNISLNESATESRFFNRENAKVLAVALVAIAIVAALVYAQVQYSALSVLLTLAIVNPITSCIITLLAVGALLYVMIRTCKKPEEKQLLNQTRNEHVMHSGEDLQDGLSSEQRQAARNATGQENQQFNGLAEWTVAGEEWAALYATRNSSAPDYQTGASGSVTAHQNVISSQSSAVGTQPTALPGIPPSSSSSFTAPASSSIVPELNPTPNPTSISNSSSTTKKVATEPLDPLQFDIAEAVQSILEDQSEEKDLKEFAAKLEQIYTCCNAFKAQKETHSTVETEEELIASLYHKTLPLLLLNLGKIFPTDLTKFEARFKALPDQKPWPKLTYSSVYKEYISLLKDRIEDLTSFVVKWPESEKLGERQKALESNKKRLENLKSNYEKTIGPSQFDIRQYIFNEQNEKRPLEEIAENLGVISSRWREFKFGSTHQGISTAKAWRFIEGWFDDCKVLCKKYELHMAILLRDLNEIIPDEEAVFTEQFEALSKGPISQVTTYALIHKAFIALLKERIDDLNCYIANEPDSTEPNSKKLQQWKMVVELNKKHLSSAESNYNKFVRPFNKTNNIPEPQVILDDSEEFAIAQYVQLVQCMMSKQSKEMDPNEIGDLLGAIQRQCQNFTVGKTYQDVPLMPERIKASCVPSLKDKYDNYEKDMVSLIKNLEQICPEDESLFRTQFNALPAEAPFPRTTYSFVHDAYIWLLELRMADLTALSSQISEDLKGNSVRTLEQYQVRLDSARRNNQVVIKPWMLPSQYPIAQS